MDHCRQCGAELDVGRFCTNCGAPVTADAPPPTERLPAVPPVPPTATQAPTEVTAARRPVLWLGAVLVLLLVAGGVWLATRDGDRDSDRTSDAAEASEQSQGVPSSAADVAPRSGIDGPPSIAPGVDLAGNPVTYSPANLVDGDHTTAYRVPGDATGRTITFTLPEESQIREVGLVNGYAKTDSRNGRAVNWYAANRKVLRVEWAFDDGSTLIQDLRIGPDLQTVAVDGTTTSAVELRILDVTAAGSGPFGKNVTAISEVLIRAG